MQVLLTGDVNLAIKARASGLDSRKLPGSAGNTIESLPRTRPELLKEFFPQVIVKTDKVQDRTSDVSPSVLSPCASTRMPVLAPAFPFMALTIT